jgi:hypothetical protein
MKSINVIGPNNPCLTFYCADIITIMTTGEIVKIPRLIHYGLRTVEIA